MNLQGRLAGRTGIGLELAVLVTAAVLFFAFFSARPGYVDPLLALLALALIAASSRRSRAIWQRTPAVAEPRKAAGMAWREALLFTAAALAVIAIIGAVSGYEAAGWRGAWLRIGNWRVVLACLLYLPWALLQQFLLQFYLAGRLHALLPYRLAIACTALAFSAVHFPRVLVMALTVVAGVFWASNYRRYRRLLPLTVSHALLGSTVHYWILGRDLAQIWGGSWVTKLPSYLQILIIDGV
jgi:membrane protease YdiL (CAAX protease family)